MTCETSNINIDNTVYKINSEDIVPTLVVGGYSINE